MNAKTGRASYESLKSVLAMVEASVAELARILGKRACGTRLRWLQRLGFD